MYLYPVKYNNSNPGFELASPCLFPASVTIATLLSPLCVCIYIYIYMYIYMCVCVSVSSFEHAK